MRILVVEEGAGVRASVGSLLSSWNMEVVPAGDADTAVAALVAGGIDVALIDLDQPGTDGLQLVQRLRADGRGIDAALLLVSGQASRQDIVTASQAGIDGFVARPFEPEQLRQRILEVHRKRRRERWQQAAARVWGKRLGDGPEGPRGPVALFGEGIAEEADLADPAQRPVVAYLDLAREVVVELNRDDPRLHAAYLICSSTTEAVLSLKRPGLRDHVRVLLVSTRCQGNPTLTARLFAINRRGHEATLYLIYDEVDEISEVHRRGLKDLGVRTLRRSRVDRSRLHNLLSQHLAAQPAPGSIDDAGGELPPQQVRSRIVEDIDTMSELPPIPRVYERISQLAREPGSDLREWIRVIQADPMTCATILRQANSLNFAVKAAVTQIDRAVILLGKNAVVGLVASTSMRNALHAIAEKGFQLEELWLHSLAVGFAAQILSHPLDTDVEELGDIAVLGLSPEALHTLRGINLPRRLGLDYGRINALAAGSLHDIGKGVMVHAYPGLYPLLRAELEDRQWGVSMLVAEREVAGGLTHTVAGDILVRRWDMADQVGNSVLAHHAPDADDGLALLVGIADVVGQIQYPFPRAGAYPLAKAVEEGDWDAARPFLPEGLLEGPVLGADELAHLVQAVGPRVRHFTEQLRRSLD